GQSLRRYADAAGAQPQFLHLDLGGATRQLQLRGVQILQCQRAAQIGFLQRAGQCQPRLRRAGEAGIQPGQRWRVQFRLQVGLLVDDAAGGEPVGSGGDDRFADLPALQIGRGQLQGATECDAIELAAEGWQVQFELDLGVETAGDREGGADLSGQPVQPGRQIQLVDVAAAGPVCGGLRMQCAFAADAAAAQLQLAADSQCRTVPDQRVVQPAGAVARILQLCVQCAFDPAQIASGFQLGRVHGQRIDTGIDTDRLAETGVQLQRQVLVEQAQPRFCAQRPRAAALRFDQQIAQAAANLGSGRLRQEIGARRAVDA